MTTFLLLSIPVLVPTWLGTLLLLAHFALNRYDAEQRAAHLYRESITVGSPVE